MRAETKDVPRMIAGEYVCLASGGSSGVRGLFMWHWEDLGDYVMSLLRTFPGRSRTLFLSIHQLVDASRVCDRLVLLSRGQIAGEGTLEELRARVHQNASLEEVFLKVTDEEPAQADAP